MSQFYYYYRQHFLVSFLEIISEVLKPYILYQSKQHSDIYYAIDLLNKDIFMDILKMIVLVVAELLNNNDYKDLNNNITF